MFERLSEKSIKVVMYAQEEARKLGDATVDLDHLLLGLMREPNTVACKVLVGRGIAYDQLREHVRNVSARPHGGGPEIPFSAHFRQALELAWEEAQHLGDEEVETEHLLLGAVEMGEGAAVRFMEGDQLDLGRLRWSVLRQRETYQGRPQLETPTVDGYCRDVTREIDREGNKHPLVTREHDLERVMQVLGAHLRPFPLLVGESGVGKTALIQACVSNLLSGYTFDHLLNSRVIELSYGRLLAETHGQQDLYTMVQKMMLELARTADIILVIEDVHWLFGEEFDSRIMMMAQLLLPVLSGNNLRCIATTSPRGLTRLESKESVLRLFQVIEIQEMRPEEATGVLTAWKPSLEQHHHLTISDDAITTAVSLARHHTPQGRLPGAALALLDAACAAKVFGNLQTRNRLRSLERRLRQLREERDQSGQQLDYNRLNRIKGQIADHESAIRDLTVSSNGGGSKRLLAVDDVKVMLGQAAE